MKAVLIGWNPKTGDVIHQECASIDETQGIRSSIEDDFPGYEWTWLADWEARKDHGDKALRYYTGELSTK